VVARQAERLAARDRQIAEMAGKLGELMETNEALIEKLARLEHLLSRNSGNSSSPPSRDGDPGKPPVPGKKRHGQSGRPRGKQPGAPGSHLAFIDDPHERCGRTPTAARPEGARPGPVGYGPNLAAFAVYLMVVHFLPTHRVVALLESLTGGAPSVGFVHGLLARTAGLLGAVHDRIRTLITLAYVVCVDETPLKVGPRTPKPGKIKAERYLLVACTQLYTHYLLGDRSLETFKAFVLAERAQRGALVVHDRYQNYDAGEFAGLVHQLCCAHLLRDLDCVILTTPPRSTPRPSGPSRSPTRCAS
jgi:transposase